MSLTTERLDEMAALHRPNGDLIQGPLCTCGHVSCERVELIEAARESVARQEAEALLPKGWCVTLNGHPGIWQAMAWNFHGGVSKGAIADPVWSDSPTAAYLALRDALRARA